MSTTTEKLKLKKLMEFLILYIFAIMTPIKNLIILRRQLKFKEMELVEMQFDP